MSYFPHILAFVFFIFFVLSALNPLDKTVWIVEIIPILSIYLLLIMTYKKFKFSNTSYTLIFIGLFWHTIGAHYTFAEVPFDFITNLFNFERNNFDRIGHIVVGFYAYPVAEFLIRKKYANKVIASFFALFFITSIAAAYEIVEWGYAVIEGGDAGIEFLGSQGDAWDAQKDMLCDIVGAIIVLCLLWIYKLKEREKNHDN